MRKRTRLRKFAGGPGAKFFLTDIQEGPERDAMTTVEPGVGMAAGQFSGIDVDPFSPYENDQILYRYEWFDKEYYPNNPELSAYFVSNGEYLNVRSDLADPVDLVQFGDYMFALTDISSANIQNAVTTTPSASGWVEESSSVVTYVPIDSLEAVVVDGVTHLYDIRTNTEIPSWDFPTSASLVDLVVSGLEFNVCPSDQDVVYGDMIDLPGGGQALMAYVKSADPSSLYHNICYGLGAGYPSIPSNFLLEVPLRPPIVFNERNEVYGDYDNGSSGPVSLYDTTREEGGDPVLYGKEEGRNKIWVNPFQLKNLYNYNYNTEMNADRTALAGIRRYFRVGKCQTLGWLCYRYYDSYGGGEGDHKMQGYDMIERLKGVYKFRSPHLHKSNIYSVRISNSGLNYDNRGDQDADAFKRYVKPIIEQAVIEVVKKLAPVGTQFWRVIWEGK